MTYVFQRIRRRAGDHHLVDAQVVVVVMPVGTNFPDGLVKLDAYSAAYADDHRLDNRNVFAENTEYVVFCFHGKALAAWERL